MKKSMGIALAVIVAGLCAAPVFAGKASKLALKCSKNVKKKKFEKAIELCKKSIEINKSDEDELASMLANMKLAAAYEGAKQYEKAADQYKIVLRYRPDELHWHFTIADMYKNAGLMDDAAKHHEIAYENLSGRMKPESFDDTLGFLISYYEEKGNPMRSRYSMRLLLKHNKKTKKLEKQLKDSETAALESCDKADTVVDEDLRGKLVKAQALRKKKNYKKAEFLYAQAIKTAPGYPIARYNLAMLEGAMENYGEAVLQMKCYLKLAPDAKNARKAQDKLYGWEAMTE
ncbi:tetratricopeptide repeat protein [Elusimicrobiota bacterium]